MSPSGLQENSSEPSGNGLGFVYVANGDTERMKDAEVGMEIENVDNAPPWIVVDHSLKSIVAAKWPGRLWKVQVVRAAPEQPNSSANYTRAVAVRVLEEVPVARLFGIHGERVCEIVAKASELQIEQVVALAEALDLGAADDAYSRAWDSWLERVDPNSSHLGESHAGTLCIFAGGTRSPIGVGLSLVYGQVVKRARALLGDSAFVTDTEGDEWLEPTWLAASSALLHAAMASGAPELLSQDDIQTLTSAWRLTFES